MTEPYHSLCKLQVTNNETLIAAVSKGVEELILSAFPAEPVIRSYAERLVSAAFEVLNNAHKFSPLQSKIAIGLAQNEEFLRFRVTNTVDQDTVSTLNEVRNQINTVWNEPNARDFFRKRVKRSLIEPDLKSMLGYAKIRMETAARIGAKLTKKNQLQISLWFSRNPNDLAFVDSP